MTFALSDTKVRVYELFIAASASAVMEAAASAGLVDDIEASVTKILKERTCQQFFKQVMGHRILGVTPRFKGTIREITRANLLASLPWAGTTASEALNPASLAGDLYDQAKVVRLHPMDLAADNYTQDIILLKCGRVGDLTLSMDGENDSGIPYEVIGYPDRSQLPSLVTGYIGPVPAAET